MQFSDGCNLVGAVVLVAMWVGFNCVWVQLSGGCNLVGAIVGGFNLCWVH